VSELSVRALHPDDAGAARALVSRQFSGTRYAARLLEQLEIAVGGGEPEYCAMVAIAPDAAVRGVALFGDVAGAQKVVKLHLLAGDEFHVLHALAMAVRDANARMVVCELADDAAFHVAAAALRDVGFAEEGRVADFVSDGVALLVFVSRSDGLL
jgi:hypothetical protein